MTRKRLTLGAAAALLALTIWLSRPFFAPSSSRPPLPTNHSEPATAVATRPETPDPKPRTQATASIAYPEAARALNAPGSDIRADLRALDELIATWRTNFGRTGNPVGTNAEITAALTGKNKLKLALLPPDHPAINAAGDLCDRWGTPFFFHAESATRMAIRSAGPDKKMWNDDDATFTP